MLHAYEIIDLNITIIRTGSYLQNEMEKTAVCQYTVTDDWLSYTLTSIDAFP